MIGTKLNLVSLWVNRLIRAEDMTLIIRKYSLTLLKIDKRLLRYLRNRALPLQSIP